MSCAWFNFRDRCQSQIRRRLFIYSSEPVLRRLKERFEDTLFAQVFVVGNDTINVEQEVREAVGKVGKEAFGQRTELSFDRFRKVLVMVFLWFKTGNVSARQRDKTRRFRSPYSEDPATNPESRPHRTCGACRDCQSRSGPTACANRHR